MLELDLDLEADLGIDTVKQAEMFAAIRAAYGIERDENLALRDYPTLGRAIEFVYERRPELRAATNAAAVSVAPAAAQPASVGPAPAAAGPAVTDAVAVRVLQIVAEQTGYPPDMLELDLDLEADLGIDTVKQAEMFAAIRAAYDIERDENLALRDYPTLARAIEFVYEKRPELRSGAAGPAAAAPTGGGAPDAGDAAPATAPAPPAATSQPRGSMEAAQRVPAACRWRGCDRPPSASRRAAWSSRRERPWWWSSDETGIGLALAERLRRMGVDALIADPSASTERHARRGDAVAGRPDRSGGCTGSPRSTRCSRRSCRTPTTGARRCGGA